ncbi:tRNA-uridine aminocarboxypropyltransferase [Vibrio sonorensis]|uniref:tRNA-uridine aminocarboxypropyltransferase n=1 Tax=Vibrio sonorensis TaxID=1004316 RepID=UPI0008D9ADF4|nr:tRNA-uridine aminocarboxypropyltransferase [Vibrio sonorensis]
MRIHQFHKLIQHRQAISTKPFNARGSKVERCQLCCVSLSHCICEFLKPSQSDFSVLLIVSGNEVLKPSNTGRLIADIVEDTHVYQWHRTEPQPSMLDLLNDENMCPILVFPEQYIENKDRIVTHPSDLPLADKKPLFVLIDGSWREARKIYNKSPYLQSLPVVSVAAERVSEYIMRKSEGENHLATAEVATMVFEQFGKSAVSKELSLWFEVFREAYLLSKTRIKPDYTRPALHRYLELER